MNREVRDATHGLGTEHVIRDCCINSPCWTVRLIWINCPVKD